MPEFIAEHVPAAADLDEFTQGYLECAEWLAHSARDEDGTGEFDAEDRESCEGWTPEAIALAVSDCADFQGFNAELLIQYEEATGRDMSDAGHDFWLTRNGHGAGFWDRGDAPCLKALSKASRTYGECDSYFDGGMLHLE